MAQKEKAKLVEELAGKLRKAKSVVLTDYRGLTVKQDTALRSKLRAVGVEYRVAKNTLVERAAQDAGVEGLATYLTGPTAFAFGYADPVAPAKVLADFAKEHKILELKGAILEGKVVGPEGAKRLAAIPPREVLLAQVLAAFQSPLTGMASLLQAPMRNLAYGLDAHRRKLEGTV